MVFLVRICLDDSEVFYTIPHIVLTIIFVHPDQKAYPSADGFAVLSHPDDDTCVLKTGFGKFHKVVVHCAEDLTSSRRARKVDVIRPASQMQFLYCSSFNLTAS